MRKTLITLMVGWAFLSVAQTNDNFSTEINHVFEHVDTNQIPTGLLRDYGVNLLPNDLLNGTLDTTNYLTLSDWRLAFATLGSYDVTGNSLISLNTVNAQLASHLANESTEPIMAFHVAYNQFDPSAVANNLMYIQGGQLYDTPNRPQSPYVQHRAIGVAMGKDALETTNGQISMVLPASLWVEASGKTLNYVRFDADDGAGYRTISVGTAFTASYLTSGEKTVKLHLNYSDGSNYYSHAKWVVTIVPTPTSGARIDCSSGSYNPSSAADESHFLVATRNHTGQSAAHGSIYVAYGKGANNDCEEILDKPLILAEGFDMWFHLGGANISYSSIFNIDGGGLGRSFPYNGSNKRFVDILWEQGYDLIFVDYTDATRHIQSNAYFVQRVIDWVNTNKTSTAEQNVVLAQSMGGLTARYALRDMELRSEDHDTRLYISYDSPHQGANILVSAQAAVRHLIDTKLDFGKVSIDLTEITPGLTGMYNALNSPAARQMLIYRVEGTGRNLSLDNSDFNTFQTELHGMGMPQQTRNVAISNGSECGETLDYNPGDVMISSNGEVKFSNFIYGLGAMVSGEKTIVGGVLSALGNPFGNVKVNMDMKMRALWDQSNQSVYKMRLYTKEKLFLVIGVEKDLIKDFNFSLPSSSLSYDPAPGGVRDFSDFNSLPSNFGPFAIQTPHQKFNFLPTYSTLDIGSGNITVDNDEVYGAYSRANPPAGNSVSSFDNWTTHAEGNSNHLDVTPEFAKFIIAELEGSTNATCFSSCGLEQANPTTTGPSLLCTSDQGTYTVSNVPAGASVTWTKSTNLSIVSENGNSLTVQAPGTNGTTGWVRPTITGACGGVELDSHTVWIQNSASMTYAGAGFECMVPEKSYTFTPAIPAASEVIQEVSINTNKLDAYIENGLVYVVNNSVSPGSSQSFTITMSLTDNNGCAITGTRNGVFYQPTPCNCGYDDPSCNGGGGPGGPLLVFPNPTEDEVTIEHKEKNDFDVWVYDFSNNLILSSTSKQGQLKKILSDFNPGTYIILIETRDGKRYQTKAVKN